MIFLTGRISSSRYKSGSNTVNFGLLDKMDNCMLKFTWHLRFLHDKRVGFVVKLTKLIIKLDFDSLGNRTTMANEWDCPTAKFTWINLAVHGWYGILQIIHYSDVIMSMMTSQITSFTIVYSIVYLSVYQRKHRSSASLAFVQGIHRWPVNSQHKGPVMQKMFPFDDVIMNIGVSGSLTMTHTARQV